MCDGERCFSVAFVTAALGRQVGAAELAAARKQAASLETNAAMDDSIGGF